VSAVHLVIEHSEDQWTEALAEVELAISGMLQAIDLGGDVSAFDHFAQVRQRTAQLAEAVAELDLATELLGRRDFYRVP
jgi:hypothetical protein